MGEGVFRPAPARAEERIAWPADGRPRFLVTVDVEEEFDWSQPLDGARRSTLAMRAFPAAHRRFADAGVGLLCFADWPIATDPDAIAILRDVVGDGRSALGAQLHAWVNPPFPDGDGIASSFPGNLPAEVEAAKLDRLTGSIAAAWGPPVAYRAGRYGIGPRTLALLASRGYRLDSSMRARHDYSDEGGPDFTAIGPHAFRRDGMIEAPLTTVFTGALRGVGPDAFRLLGRVPRGRGIASRTGLLTRVALTPEGMPLGLAERAVDAALDERVALIVLSFHSPSLEPGHTPYVRTAADRVAFDRWWDGMLAHLAARGVAATTLAEVLAAAG